MAEQEKIFLSDEHKEFLIKPDNDEAYKRQLLDSVDYLARNMPKCNKEEIKEQIKTGLGVARDGRRVIWAVLILIIGGAITGSLLWIRV